MQIGRRSGGTFRLPFTSGPPRSSRMALASFAIVLAVSVLAMPFGSLGADADRGRDIVVEANEVLREDAYWLAATVDFFGSSERDVSIVSGNAEVSGDIAGSLQLAVGQGTVTGNVGGSIRVIGGSVELRGDVGGDIIVVGGRVTIPSSSTVTGDVIVAGGDVDVRGTVQGDITGYTWRLIVAGTVQGSVDVNVSDLDVRSTAVIQGDLTYHTYLKPTISDGATIGGTITDPPNYPWDSLLNPTGLFGPLLRVMWSLLAGAALILIAPRIASAMSTNAGSYVRSGILGVIGIVTIPVLAVILLVSIIGLPVGLLMLAVLLIALYLSQIAVGLAIGRFILPKRWHDGSRGYYLLAMTLGVLAVGIVKMIPVPWIAGIVGLIVTIWGLGAVLMLFSSVITPPRSQIESA
ncbi:MAG: polymer-forming cytoskeletal protein [Thermomicrobiales bacterium]